MNSDAPGLVFETWETTYVDGYGLSNLRQELKLPFKSKSGKPRAFLNEAGLYDYAVKALGRSMRTESELRRQMHTRVEPGDHGEEIVSTVVKRLREHGYLNDAAFAETFARLRQENEKFGVRRVRQDLQRKGVHTELVEQTLDARYGQTNEEALARQHLERKRIKKPENEKATARVVRRLVAAGFSTSTIFKILRKWDVPDEALAALESIEEGPHEE
jgi:regulatory protein